MLKTYGTNKKWIFLVIIIVGLLGGVYYWYTASATPEPLLVVHTATAEVVVNQKESKVYLIVHPIGKKIIKFTDRPRRETGSFPVEQFFDVWANDSRDSFANDPPNASIAGLWKGKSFSAFIGLSNPVYDDKTNALRFEITRLDGQKVDVDKQLLHATLFIE